MENTMLHIPVEGCMVRQPDGSYKLDPARSTYADISADDFAEFLIHQFGHDAIFKGAGADGV